MSSKESPEAPFLFGTAPSLLVLISGFTKLGGKAGTLFPWPELS